MLAIHIFLKGILSNLGIIYIPALVICIVFQITIDIFIAFSRKLYMPSNQMQWLYSVELIVCQMIH